MKITTWNINGIRAALGKEAFKWLIDYQPDVVCLQEIKAKVDQIDTPFFESLGYKCVWNPAERPGYSGTGTLFKIQPASSSYGIGVQRFDNEGRIITSIQISVWREAIAIAWGRKFDKEYGT